MEEEFDAKKLATVLSGELENLVGSKPETAIIGIVKKGLAPAKQVSKELGVDLIPLCAERTYEKFNFKRNDITAYFPHPDWAEMAGKYKRLIIVDDAVQTQATIERVVSFIFKYLRENAALTLSALVINKSAKGVDFSNMSYAVLGVNAKDITCSWGLDEIEIRGLVPAEANKEIEKYYQKNWVKSNPKIKIKY